MSDNPTFFRAVTVATLGLLATLALLSRAHTTDRLPDAAELAARLMAPMAEPKVATEQEPPATPEVTPMPQSARIHAEPAPTVSVATSPILPEGTGITQTPDETAAEVVESPLTPPEATEVTEAPVENVGDSEGERMAVAELAGLNRAVVDRLLAENAATLVAELGDGRQLMLEAGDASAFVGFTFAPWGPSAADHSQLQIVLPSETDFLPTAAIRLGMLKEVGPVSVMRYALVLSVEAEQVLRITQQDLLAEAGIDHDTVLATNSSVVTGGCWQAHGPILRLTDVTVDGATWRHPSRQGC